MTFTLTPQEFHYNPLGSVHGGVLSTLLDSAAGCAVHSTLPAGYGYTSLDLSIKFLRPVTVDSGRLRCAGMVLNRGRTTALAEARLTDGRERLVAHATSTCLIFEVPVGLTLQCPLGLPAGGPDEWRAQARRAAAAAMRSSVAVSAAGRGAAPAGP